MSAIRFKFVILLLFVFLDSHAQTLDTLMDVGNYKLHFHILKGQGTPILFDAGGGNDATVWNDLLPKISEITGTTLIAYDRAGFGKSTLDTNKHGILPGIMGLEAGLHKLGYDKEIILVAHSQGALYATVYACRHPDKVKAAVLIDGSTSCWFAPRLEGLQRQNDLDKIKFKKTNLGTYYQLSDLALNVNLVSRMPFPVSIPVIDFASENPPFDKTDEVEDWRRCHREFVMAANNRIAITAYDCGHYIFLDNPTLVINAITKTYAASLTGESKNMILSKIVNYNLTAVNEMKRSEAEGRHSEIDLNSWGYSLVRQGKLTEALAVFKLNTLMYPNSWNAYDSYGETLLKNGQKQEALKMYERSVELNPNSENGKKVLKMLMH
jgi:pimeloyl-ACP methyl ester carboxylesterase